MRIPIEHSPGEFAHVDVDLEVLSHICSAPLFQDTHQSASGAGRGRLRSFANNSLHLVTNSLEPLATASVLGNSVSAWQQRQHCC